MELDSAKFKTTLDNSSSMTQLELRCRSGRGKFIDRFIPDFFHNFAPDGSTDVGEQSVKGSIVPSLRSLLVVEERLRSSGCL